ncbi:MAG: hypothetical protein Q4B50_05130, partial [Bacillota bacterium]|nr:hypothetical protein [Bacillota bacterium]
MKGTVSTHPSNLLDVNSSLYSIKEEFIDDASEDSFQDDQMGSNQAQNKFILVEEEQVSSEPNDMDILEWYSTFGKELREKAYVDLERKEDLGRVWFYDIKKWDAENIATAQGEIIYAFIPRKEGKYLPPPPERNRENPEEYEKWMLESQKLGLEVEEIRELWRRSRDGTLMVTAPDGSMEYMQILTMDDGSLVFSQPADKIAPPEILDREVPHILPMPKEPTAARIERALPEPTSPKINNPMAEPGWFSWLGYVFGIHTAYTDYMAEQETIKQWNEYNRVKTNIDQWKRYDNNLLAYNQSVAEYPQKKDEYEKAAAEGMKNKTVKFIAISEGIKGRMYDGEATDFVDYLSDNRFWTRKHRRTDLGRIRTGRDNAIRRLGNSKILDKAIDRLMGPTVKSYGELSDKYVFEAECFDVNDPKAVPGLPLSETRPENYQVPTGYLNGGKALTDREISVICFAALADGRVSSAPPLEGYDEENSTMLNFAEVLNDFFLEGIPRSDHLLPFLNRARNLGSNLVRIYAETGDNTDISKMLANCVRNLNHQAFVHSLNPEKHFVVCGALRPIMDVFDKHPELLKASGLEEGELKEAQSNLLIHEVCVKGREAKVKLGDYGLHLIDLSVQERKEYMKDVLAMEAMDQRLHEEWQTRELDIYTKSMNKDDREFRYKLRTTLRGLAKEMSVLVDTITLA